MKWKFSTHLIIGILVLLTLTACSNNKQNINEQMFEEGEKLVQQYYQAAINDDDSLDKTIAQPFLKKYKKGEYGKGLYASDAEELFVESIESISLDYEVYEMNKALEKFSGEYHGSDQDRETLLKDIYKIHEEFGINYD